MIIKKNVSFIVNDRKYKMFKGNNFFFFPLSTTTSCVLWNWVCGVYSTLINVCNFKELFIERFSEEAYESSVQDKKKFIHYKHLCKLSFLFPICLLSESKLN